MSPPLGDGDIQFYPPFVKKWFPCNNLKTPQHKNWRQKLVVIEFIIAIVVTKYILSILKHLTLFLQKTNCDMVVAFDEAQNTLNMLKGLRTDEKISEFFARAQITADTMEVVLQPMRRVGRQVHRDNPNVNSAEQQCTLPFLTTLTMNSSEDFLVISSKWCPASSITW